jgi:hypothetical protein
MKKLFNLALLGAIALTGAVGFSSCSSSSDEVIDNPNYDPETNTVKAQFAISLPQEIKSQTRQTGTVVQETGFRGMDNIKLIPYSEVVTATSTANSNLTELTPIDVFDHDESNSKVYTDVEFIPGTTNFLLYAKAVDNTAGTDITSAADKFKFGSLTVAGLTGKPTLSSVTFTPKAIYEDGDATEQTAITAGKAVGANLIAALNAVANAAPTTALAGGGTPKFKEVAATVNPTVNALFNTYKALTTASSHSVQTMFFKLYSSLDPLAAGSGDDLLLATAIRTAIETYCDITKDGTTNATTAVTFKASANLTGYPASVNLPDGAVRVTYSSDSFVATTNMTYAGTMNVTTLDKYVYPANLQYFVNSPIKVANSQKSPLYNTSNWETILGLYTDGTSITANTRSVAITNPIQYGVGRLDASVSQLSGTYYDYNGDEVNVTNGFTLTGILIGDQKPVVWDFTTKTGATAYTVYDKSLNAGNWTVTTSAASATNHTLVLETVGGDSPENVRVALEFLNNGNEFVGANGEIIPAGGRFYLVGELKPSDGSVYDATSKGKDRVFTQDYKTIATFTINNGSNDPTNINYRKGLGSATNGLPDLRTSSMELGLSVDLTWKAGLTFNVNM